MCTMISLHLQTLHMSPTSAASVPVVNAAVALQQCILAMSPRVVNLLMVFFYSDAIHAYVEKHAFQGAAAEHWSVCVPHFRLCESCYFVSSFRP